MTFWRLRDILKVVGERDTSQKLLENTLSKALTKARIDDIIKIVSERDISQDH